MNKLFTLLFLFILSIVQSQVEISPIEPLCRYDDIVELTLVSGLEPVGDFSGTGVEDMSFDPWRAGEGVHKIKYVEGSDSDSIEIVVVDMDIALIHSFPREICISDSPKRLELDPSSTSGGLFYSHSAEVDPYTGEVDLLASGPGYHSVYYQTSGLCPVNDSVVFEVVAPADPFILAIPELCENGDPFYLEVVTPGGTFSGLGADPVSGMLDPSFTGPGFHSVTYQLGGLCPTSHTANFIVNELPEYDLITPSFCEDDSVARFTTSPSPLSGKFFLDLNSDGEFFPNKMDSGSYDIGFAFSDGFCVDTTVILDAYIIDDSKQSKLNSFEICENSDTIIDYSGKGVDFEWSNGSTESGITISVLNETIYTSVFITDENDCHFLDTIKLVPTNCDGVELVKEMTGIEFVKIFPNPSTGLITIQFDYPYYTIKSQLNIYNSIGKRVGSHLIQIDNGENLVNLDLSELAAGAYFVSIQEMGLSVPVTVK